MKLFKPLLTVLVLAFALIFITACSSGGNAGSSSGKTTAKARTIDEIKKSGELRIAVFGDKKLLATLTMMVLTKATILN